MPGPWHQLLADHCFKLPFGNRLGLAEDIAPCLEGHILVRINLLPSQSDDGLAAGEKDFDTISEFLDPASIRRMAGAAFRDKRNFLYPLPAMGKSILTDLAGKIRVGQAGAGLPNGLPRTFEPLAELGSQVLGDFDVRSHI